MKQTIIALLLMLTSSFSTAYAKNATKKKIIVDAKNLDKLIKIMIYAKSLLENQKRAIAKQQKAILDLKRQSINKSLILRRLNALQQQVKKLQKQIQRNPQFSWHSKSARGASCEMVCWNNRLHCITAHGWQISAGRAHTSQSHCRDVRKNLKCLCSTHPVR